MVTNAATNDNDEKMIVTTVKTSIARPRFAASLVYLAVSSARSRENPSSNALYWACFNCKSSVSDVLSLEACISSRSMSCSPLIDYCVDGLEHVVLVFGPCRIDFDRTEE